MSVLSQFVAPALTGLPLLAAGRGGAPTPPPAPASGQEFGSASTLGFVVLVLFFIAVAFLARSMAKHLKRIQKPFEDAERAESEAEAESASSSDTAPSDTTPSDTAPSDSSPDPQHKADA